MVKNSLIVWMSLLFLIGCASQPTVPVADRNSPEAAGKPVVLLDEDMDHYVAVDAVRAGKNENGYLVVQASVRNRAERDFVIQAQTVFYDANGNALGYEETAWTVLPLTANITLPYRAQALQTGAEKFTIRLRYAARKTY